MNNRRPGLLPTEYIAVTFMGLLNTRTPSGRVTVMSPVAHVASVVNGTVVKISVKTHQVVKRGDVLFTLDKRPFEFAVQQAKANFDIAEVTFKRVSAAVEKNPATYSPQKVDETRAQFEAAQAALESAHYNLDRSAVLAIGEGVIGPVRLRVGDKVAAFKPVFPFIHTGAARIWGVFQQNGHRAIRVGAPVGISLNSEPSAVRWTKIIEISPGTAGGQVPANAELLGGSDFGNTDEILVVLEWPSGLSRGAVRIGNIGAATIIGPDAGAIGSLAKILLKVKSFAQYL